MTEYTRVETLVRDYILDATDGPISAASVFQGAVELGRYTDLDTKIVGSVIEDIINELEQ